MNNSNEIQSSINQAQLNNYKQWINSHLKKRPGVKLIDNLQADIIDGVALVHLIEIISGYVLPDVNLNPNTMNDYKENIEKVLKFIQNNQVKMQRATSKEILEGNIKSIMRLVLALAAHFKPTNLHQNTNSAPSSNPKKTTSCSTLQTNKNTINNNKIYTQSAANLQQLQVSTKSSNKNVLNQTRTLDSMTHLVQAACVSIADVRRYGNAEKNFNVKYVKRNNLISQIREQNDQCNEIPTSNVTDQTYVTKNYKQLPTVSIPFSNENSIMLSPSQKPVANSTMLNSTSLINHVYENEKPKQKVFKEPFEPVDPIYTNNMNLTEIKSTSGMKPRLEINGSNLSNQTITISDNSTVNNLIAENAIENLEDVSHIKNMLLKLQTLLMSEQPDMNTAEAYENQYYNNCEDEEGYALSSLTQEEQITILRSKVQQLEIVCGDLRGELNKNNFVSMHQVGEGIGLKTRLNEQDNTILEMKTEQLNMHLTNQQLLQENEALRVEFQKQSKLMNELKFKVFSKDEIIEGLKADMSKQSGKKEDRKENVLKEIMSNQEKSLNDVTFTVKREPTNENIQIINSKTERILKEALYQIRQNCLVNFDQSTALILKKYEKEIKLISEKTNNSTNKILVQNSNLVVGINNNSPKSVESIRSLCESSSASMNSSNSSSVTTSSANSPIMPISMQLYNNQSSSSNSSSNITITKYVNQYESPRSKNISDEDSSQSRLGKIKQFQLNDDLNLVNNLGHVKKIISQFSIEQKELVEGSNKKIVKNNDSEKGLDKKDTLLTITSVNYQNNKESNASTKCFYYLNNENESHCFTISKSINKISLRDFKEHVKLNNSSEYRYFFKNQEPEFGFLKEEITEDTAILPNFDRNIVAWIEAIN